MARCPADREFLQIGDKDGTPMESEWGAILESTSSPRPLDMGWLEPLEKIRFITVANVPVSFLD
jgi:hypothetical protein